MDNIFKNLFKKKTMERLEQTTRKFVAGITILMSVFYGTLYYALVTLASEGDNVPKPLIINTLDSANYPHKFYLESISNSTDKIDGLTTLDHGGYKEFLINGNRIMEPTPLTIQDKLYVPFRLLIASGSDDYEVEMKSKKGIQKISLAADQFEYQIFEKRLSAATKGFLKLAAIKPEFQVRQYELVEIPVSPPAVSPLNPPASPTVSPSFDVPTPEPTPDSTSSPQANPTDLPQTEPVPVETSPDSTNLPQTEPTISPQSFWNGLINEAQADEDPPANDWQGILFAGPVSASWSIYGNYIEIKQSNNFSLDAKDYTVWLSLRLGFDGSEYINSWDFGVSGQEAIKPGTEFRARFHADLSGKIGRKISEDGNLSIDIKKDENDLAVEAFDLEKELDKKPAEPEATEPPVVMPESLSNPEPNPEPDPEPSPEPVFVPRLDPAPAPITSELPAPELGSAQGEAESELEVQREEIVIPAPEFSPEPEPIQTEPSPTLLLNQLFGINVANAEEVIDQIEEPGNLVVEPLSNEGGGDEKGEASFALEQISLPQTEPTAEADSIISATTEIIDRLTDGLFGFVESAAVSAPPLESVENAGEASTEAVTILEEPVAASVDSTLSTDSTSSPQASSGQANSPQADSTNSPQASSEQVDLSETPHEPESFTAQLANVLSGLNVFSDAATITSELNFGFGEEGGVNLIVDEENNIFTTEITLINSASSSADASGTASSTDGAADPIIARATISDIGVKTDKAGIWVASGDGSKVTDFKIHFNPGYGGAIDRLYLGTDFINNKVVQPQIGSGGLTLLEQNGFSQAETKSFALEVIEQSKVRVVVRNVFSLGRAADIEEKYAIYATGKIIKTVIYDKNEVGEERWYLNAAKTGFDLPAGYNQTQLIINTKLESNSKDLMLVWQNHGSMASSTFETVPQDTKAPFVGVVGVGEAPFVGEQDSWITVVKSNRQPWTYTEHQMIDLMQEDLSLVDKTAIDERAADYRNPDNPEFTLGRFIQFNKHYGSYEMESAANQNRVIFTLDGSEIPRFQPIFEIHDWESPDLKAVKAFLNQKNMVENRDFMVDFKNGDPMTGVLIFHFLGIVRVNSEFSTDGFGVFDIDPEVAPGGGIFTYGGNPVNTSTVTSNGDGHSFGAFASLSQSTVNPVWIVNRANPIGSALASGSDNEHLVGAMNVTGVLEMLRWNGTAWALEWTENNVGSQSFDTRAYDIAYESGGEAVAAWGATNATTNQLEYRVWNGTSWGASASLDLPLTAEKITWVEMASHPASGSNQNDIGMCYVTGGVNATDSTMVGCAIWNGTTNAWGNTKLVESNADESANNAGSTNTAAVFYEQSSAQLVAGWGIEHAGNTTAVGIGSITYDDVGGWSATAGFAFGANGDGASTLVCAPMPTVSSTIKNKGVCTNYHGASADVNAVIWSGTAFGQAPHTGAIDSGSGSSGIGQVRVAATWLTESTNRSAVVAWSSADTTDVDYVVFDDAAGTWIASTSFAHTTGTDINYGFASSPNPDRKNTTLLFLNDVNLDTFGYEASLSGTTVTFSNMNNGEAITRDNSSNATNLGLPFMMTYDLFPNPTQIHYRWRNDDGTLATATAAANEDTQLTGLATSTVKRLRIEISNEGVATDSYNFQLEFAKKGTGCAKADLSAGWNYREVRPVADTASDAFDIELSSNFANGDATADGDTASLTNEDTTFVAGQGIESASSTSAITLTGNNFTEIEFALQANANSQASTNYCFRITDGGASTSFTFQRYAEVQTAAAAVPPTYTQDFFRFYVNTDGLTPTDPWPSVGGFDLAENATMSAHFSSVASGSITRLRSNILVGTDTLNASSQSFKIQYAQGFYCGAVAGGSWADVGASTSNTIWRFGSNTSVTSGTTLASPALLSNSTDGARATYEEGNPSAKNPSAVSSGQRMEHDWSLQNNGAVSGASYCFRMIRNSGTVFETYNRWPLVVLGPSTDQVLRHGAFFSEGVEQGYYWSGI